MVSGHRPPRSHHKSLEGFHADVTRSFHSITLPKTEMGRCQVVDFRKSVQLLHPAPVLSSQPIMTRGRPQTLVQVYSVRANAGITEQKERQENAAADPEQARLKGLLIHSAFEAHIKQTDWLPEVLWPSFNPAFGYEDLLQALVQETRAEWHRLQNSELIQRLLSPANKYQAEVPVCALLNSKQLLRGRIDLVVESASEHMIIDYKTSSMPGAAKNYMAQIAAYCQAWQQIITDNKPVRGYILFTSQVSLHQIWPHSPIRQSDTSADYSFEQ
jgi:hypothetical protein